MAKIQFSQRMYSILDISRLLDSEELSIQPKYQRRRTAWPINAKTALMDTIFNNFPLPPIYLRDYVDGEGKKKKKSSMDNKEYLQLLNIIKMNLHYPKTFMMKN